MMISEKEVETEENVYLKEPNSPVTSSKHRISNVKVLMLTGFLFGCFMIAEMIAALESNSLALLGDALATLVDVGTCCSNLFAESTKAKSVLNTPAKLVLEIYIPAISAICLLGVTSWITISAIIIILHGGSDSSVDLAILWILSTINLLIDLSSALLFYSQGKEILQSPNKKQSVGQDFEVREGQTLLYHTNLNMLSTLTHVGGDLMRTIAVLTAATFAAVFNLNSSLCDAWASILVSISIVMIVCPLLRELLNAFFDRENHHHQENDIIILS